MGPCLCGDTYCIRCGPQQGNTLCEVCGRWSMDGGCEDAEKCNEIYRRGEQTYEEELEYLNQLHQFELEKLGEA